MAAPVRRPIWSRLLVAVAATAVSLWGVEMGYRWADPLGLSYFREATRYFHSAMRPDRDFAYVHKPNLRMTFQGVEVRTNRDGLRWRDMEPKAPGVRRLLILGDSVVFGWGARQESLFPHVVEAALSRRSPPWDVVSAGSGSWNTRTEFEWYRKAGHSYDADLVVLFVVPNDIEPKRRGNTDVPREELLTRAGGSVAKPGTLERWWRSLTRVSDVARHIQSLRRVRGARQAQRDRFAPDAPEWRDVRLALQGLDRETRARGVRLAAALYGDSRGFVDRYTETLDARGIPHVSVVRATRPEWNSPTDIHPNAQGHARIGRDLLAFLEPLIDRLEGDGSLRE